MTITAAQLEAEAQKFGVPDWIWIPLAGAESSGNPNAPGGGLFQVQPGYVGYSLPGVDPASNTQPAFAELGAVYKAQGSPSKSLTSYENVISRSGFDTFAGWAQEGVGTTAGPAAVQSNYISNYNLWSDAYPNIPGKVPGLTPPPPVTVSPLPGGGLFGGTSGPFVTVANFFGTFTNALGWMKDHPIALVVFLAALLVFAGSAVHLAQGTGIQLKWPETNESYHFSKSGSMTRTA